MLISVLPYYAFLLAAFFIALLEAVTKRKVFFVAMVALVWFFVALRWITGNDWPAYRDIFDQCGVGISVLECASVHAKEPLFIFLMYGFQSLGFEFFLAFISTFQIFVFALVAKRLTRYPASLFFLSIPFLVFTLYFSTLRQALAVSFVMLGFYVLLSGRKKLAALLSGVAILFHLSAIVYFVSYLLSLLINNGRRFHALVFFFFTALFLVLLAGKDIAHIAFLLLSKVPYELLSSKALYYLEARRFSYNLYELSYFLLIVAIGIFLSREIFFNVEGKYRLIASFCLVAAFIQVCFLFTPLLRNRILYVEYPVICLIIIWSLFYVGLGVRVLVLSAFLSFYLLFYAMFLGRESTMMFVPYRNLVMLPFYGEVAEKEMLEQMLDKFEIVKKIPGRQDEGGR